MKTIPAAEKVAKQLDDLIAMWTEHEDFVVAPDVTLKSVKATRADLGDSVDNVAVLRRNLKEETDNRNDLSKLGNGLVVRSRKAVAGYFGLDSKQYSQVGGTRTSDRKASKRKITTLAKAA